MKMNPEKLKQLQDQVRIGGKVCVVCAVYVVNFVTAGGCMLLVQKASSSDCWIGIDLINGENVPFDGVGWEFWKYAQFHGKFMERVWNSCGNFIGPLGHYSKCYMTVYSRKCCLVLIHSRFVILLSVSKCHFIVVRSHALLMHSMSFSYNDLLAC